MYVLKLQDAFLETKSHKFISNKLRSNKFRSNKFISNKFRSNKFRSNKRNRCPGDAQNESLSSASSWRVDPKPGVGRQTNKRGPTKETEDGMEILVLDPILRFWNLQLQHQRCSNLERFFKVEWNVFVFKTPLGYSWRCKLLQCWRCNFRS
jgi:hypothetical protein